MPLRHNGSAPLPRASRRGRFEPLEDRRLLAATPIEVYAAGLSGTEKVALEISGVEVRRWENVGGDFSGGQFVTLDYTHPTDATADDVVVRLVDSAGAGKDLRVDGVRVAGAKFEAESPTNWNTGTWSNQLSAIVPGFAGSEYIYSNLGALHFSADATSQLRVRAAGATGEELMRLWIDGVAVAEWADVGGDYNNRAFVAFDYTHPSKVAADRVRVEFVNDGRTADDRDRNLKVDAITIDGRVYHSEATTTMSTGTWRDGEIVPGFPQSESLHGEGFFQYSSRPAGGSRMIVFAAGTVGDEEIAVNVAGSEAARIRGLGGDYNLRRFEPHAVIHPRTLSIDDLEVAFLNDGSPGGFDRNVRIDAIELDGVRNETEDLTTFSTGTYLPDRGGVKPGFVQDERLHINGVLQYGQDPDEAGELSLGETQYRVNETGGFVEVGFVRTADRGSVTLDYTTVDGEAIAGEDYTTTSGTLVFADGQTVATVQIPILDDNALEGRHAFNLSADRVTGGATLGQPRTTTVTIFDDDAPNLGDGVGLLGQYYSGTGFGTLLTERTDATIDFNWGNGSPAPSVGADNFSVRWTGEIEPLYSETYTFETITDDGVRLWINNQLIIDRWIDQAPTAHTGSITLEANVKYDIRMEMYEQSGVAAAQLRWSSASQPYQIVPTSQLYSEVIIPETGQFVAETIIDSGLSRPTGIDFSVVNDDDYLFISQQDGRVRLAIDGVLQSEVVVDYRTPVNNVRDRGLLGMAVHPDLTANPYLYLLYTYDPPETAGQSGLAAPDNFGNRGSRLTRLTLDASNAYRTVVPGSDVVLLGTGSTWNNLSSPDKDSTSDIGLPPSGLDQNGDWVPDILITDSQSHTIGALDFGPDGSLFVTNGDGTSYGRVDPRTTRVQDRESLSGKVLRIDPLTGEGYSDNPFYTGDTTDDQSKVYNYGLRNPFTLAVEPNTGVPYVGDVGWNSWEEINGGRGQNFGWPFYEGGAASGGLGGDAINRQTGGYKDLAEAQAFYAAGGDALATPPLWSRSHGAGGVAIVLGDFYTGDLYPSRFDNALFFTDFGDPTVRAITLDAEGALDQSYVVMGSVGQVVEMSMGPDGRMYFVDLQGKIGRINYVEPPAELASADAGSPLTAPASLPFEEPVNSGRGAASLSIEEPSDTAFALLLLEGSSPGGVEDSAAEWSTADETDQLEESEEGLSLGEAF
ncbi:Quinoprotein glucose dehydrogenase B precursor [Planctomycetes bacterium MalM25]|nr:Quinoprotein glucose dehydrogenase B precursor [Planctomycetes bacterium MalM25]